MLKWIPRGLAVILPALLATIWLGPLADPFAPVDRGAMGEGRDQEPMAIHADVVVVGNSLARHGLDLEALAQGLGARSAEIIWERGSGPPLWYAALKNNLFAHGGRPKLVIVVNTMSGFLDATLPKGRQLRDLRLRLSDDEPLLAAKVFGLEGAHTPLDRMYENRRIPRDRYINQWKRLGTEDHEAVLGELFDDAPNGTARRVRAIPVVELKHVQRAPVLGLEDSLVGDLIDLVQGHGSQIAFARIPIPPSGREDWPLAPDDATRLAEDLFAARGVGYVDLHDLALSEADFLDDHHLNRRGQKAYTAALTAQILEIGGLNGLRAPEAGSRDVAPAKSTNAFRFLGGKRGTAPATYARGEREWAHPDPIPVGDDVYSIAIPELEAISVDGLRRLTANEPGLSWVGKCSPVRLRANERWLDKGGSGPKGIAGGPVDRYRHTGDVVLFRPIDPQEHFAVSLTPDRGCRSFTWLYPDDEVVFSLGTVSTMEHSASVLTLGGFVFGEGVGRIVLEVGDRVFLDRDVDLTELNREGLSLQLNEALAARPQDVSLSLTIPEDGPFILMKLGLLEQAAAKLRP